MQVIVDEYRGPDCIEIGQEGQSFRLTYIHNTPKSRFKNTLLDHSMLFATKVDLLYFLSLVRLIVSHDLEHTSTLDAAVRSVS